MFTYVLVGVCLFTRIGCTWPHEFPLGFSLTSTDANKYSGVAGFWGNSKLYNSCINASVKTHINDSALDAGPLG